MADIRRIGYCRGLLNQAPMIAMIPIRHTLVTLQALIVVLFCPALVAQTDAAALPLSPTRILIDSDSSLTGHLCQGGMLIGQTRPDAQVRFQDQEVMLSPTGRFAIGFGRDADLHQLLHIEYRQSNDALTVPLELAARRYDIQRIDGLPPAQVTPPEEVLQRIAEDNRRVAQARRKRLEREDFAGPFIRPAEGRLSGVYGSQRVLNGEPRRPHFGLDIANATGTAVVAPAGGEVSLADPDQYYSGGLLIIDHGHGVTSSFLHLSELLVALGDTVEQGQIIGRIGATGRVTGPHLDWRMNVGSARIDPGLLLSKEDMAALTATPTRP